MRTVDKKIIIAFFCTFTILFIVLISNNTSYALEVCAPKDIKLQPSSVDNNALTLEYKSCQSGTNYSYEIFNITDGKVNIVSGSTERFTFQNLESGKNYEVIMRTCIMDTNNYSCSLYTSKVSATTKGSANNNTINNTNNNTNTNTKVYVPTLVKVSASSSSKIKITYKNDKHI